MHALTRPEDMAADRRGLRWLLASLALQNLGGARPAVSC